MEFPNYKKATLGAVAYGSCLATSQCETEGADNVPIYSLDKLSPGVLNPLGAWTRFKNWLREWGDLMALVCILIFVGTTLANLTTILVAAVQAGPAAASAVSQRFYDRHRRILKTTIQYHQGRQSEETAGDPSQVATNLEKKI